MSWVQNRDKSEQHRNPDAGCKSGFFHGLTMFSVAALNSHEFIAISPYVTDDALLMAAAVYSSMTVLGQPTAIPCGSQPVLS